MRSTVAERAAPDRFLLTKPSAVIVFPQCKINLGLHVTGKRPDGYHNLESVFYPLPLRDALEIVDAPVLELFQSGIKLTGPDEENLCLKAYQLVKARFPDLPPVAIHLHKTIPAGAGLGGGSSDGARMLVLLNQHLRLGLSPIQLSGLSLELGSDCPFFLLNTPAFVQGRGEIIEPVALDLSAWSFLLVHPPVKINTKDAFPRLVPAPPSRNILKVVRDPITSWKDQLINDFEKPAFEQFPFLPAIKTKLYDAGALYASMSGSGSSFYGIFKKLTVPQIDFGPDVFVTILK